MDRHGEKYRNSKEFLVLKIKKDSNGYRNSMWLCSQLYLMSWGSFNPKKVIFITDKYYSEIGLNITLGLLPKITLYEK